METLDDGRVVWWSDGRDRGVVSVELATASTYRSGPGQPSLALRHAPQHNSLTSGAPLALGNGWGAVQVIVSADAGPAGAQDACDRPDRNTGRLRVDALGKGGPAPAVIDVQVTDSSGLLLLGSRVVLSVMWPTVQHWNANGRTHGRQVRTVVEVDRDGVVGSGGHHRAIV